MVVMFLHILGHDKNDRAIHKEFQRSIETISQMFCSKNLNQFLPTVWTKDRGGLRKNIVATNVLGVCVPDMQFIYTCLVGKDQQLMEGCLEMLYLGRMVTIILLTLDIKVVKDFVLHIEKNPPVKEEELFNTKHAFTRNVIERTFRLLKIRCAIIMNMSYYPIASDIILACCYLDNLVRQQMATSDAFVEELDVFIQQEEINGDTIQSTKTSSQWNEWRVKLADE
ncbi:hypothetical protein U9M48_009084, partial [Paspalum notatum var. saurae]